MVKKTLLSIAIAASVAALAGCNVSTTDKYDNKITDYTPAQNQMPKASAFHPRFAPENADVPVATDFLFASASATDGTADTKVTEATFPVTTAINKLAGFSSTAPIYLSFTDEIDPSSFLIGGALPQIYLIKLHNSETLGVPVDALDLADIVKQSTIEQSPTGPIAGALAYGTDFTVDAVNLGSGSGKKDTLRILLKKPLDPKTKYIVALTDGIKGVSSGTEVTTGSPTFQLVSGDKILPSAALEPVRTAVQSWKKIAGGAIAVGTQGALTEDNIILSYAFTTDASLDDIKQYAAPGLFVKNNVPLAFAESQLPAGVSDQIAGLVMQTSGGTITTIEAAKKTDAYATQVFKTIAGAQGLNLDVEAAAPAPRNVKLVSPAAVDAVLSGASPSIPTGASPATLLTMVGVPGNTDTSTRYIQGSIQLPDFLGAATKTDMGLVQQDPKAAVAQAWRADHNWEANADVGAMLSAALNKPGAFPPKDKDGSTNVTYRYPFPQQVGINSAPFLLTLPSTEAPASCASPFKTVIFVHGITSNRAGSAIYAAQLAGQCIATIAIDLPLHGVAPKDGMQTMLSMSTANAADTSSPWAAVAVGAMATNGVGPIGEVAERHGNIWQNANSMRVNMDYSVIADAKDMPSGTPQEKEEQAKKYASGGDSGSAFINLQNFGRTHDNLRQSVTDLLNLNASLVNINKALAADTELNGASANRGTLDLNKVFVAGHSLGGIVASAFVAANNDPEVQAFVGYNPNGGGVGVATGALPKVQGLIIANSGGQLTKLLENSPAFAPAIVGGLAQNGTVQGSENFEKFLSVFQATVDGIDPANTVRQLGSTPVQMFTVVGDSINAQLDPMTSNMPDNTVPVRDYFADETTNPFFHAVNLQNGPIKLPSAGVPTAKSFLAGTQAINVAQALNADSDFGNQTYITGTHGSFAKPDVADSGVTFGDMISKSIGFILNKTPTNGAN